MHRWFVVPATIVLLAYSAEARAAQPRILRGPDFASRIAALDSVAILPMDCPGTLDCASSERELVAYLRGKQKLRVVDSSRVSQLLFERDLAASALTGAETGPSFLAEFGVSAFLLPAVLDYQRVEKYLGGGPGVELRAELSVVIPGTPPLAKGNDTDGGPDMQLAGKPPLARILVRLAKAIFGPENN